MRQAVPARPDELEARARLRRAFIAKDQADAAALRRGLIYTAHGVIDMTRRRITRQPAVEQIVETTGGAKLW